MACERTHLIGFLRELPAEPSRRAKRTGDSGSAVKSGKNPMKSEAALRLYICYDTPHAYSYRVQKKKNGFPMFPVLLFACAFRGPVPRKPIKVNP